MSAQPIRAPLALSMGEPAGIGPELIARAWTARAEHRLPPFFFIGDPQALRAHGFDGPIIPITDPAEAVPCFAEALPVLPITLAAPATPGTLDPRNGPAVIAAIDRGTALCRDGLAGGLVTAPIHKKALYDAGFSAPGHTEYLARLCGLADEAAVMMLAVPGLRVVPLTIHQPLARVPGLVTKDLILRTATTILFALQSQFGIPAPRLSVAGLNPHAGEDASIGTEERDIIAPAVAELCRQGWKVTGPHSADSLFHGAARSAYDAVLCMYHDQALIPLKTVDFDRGVNVTLGLPIIRTSPDHGTALDIAGQSRANPTSMLEAIRLAGELAAGAAS